MGHFKSQSFIVVKFPANFLQFNPMFEKIREIFNKQI